MPHKSFLCVFLALGLAACGGKTSSGLERDAYRQTVGVGIIASFNEMCGATRIEEFREAWLRHLGAGKPLTAPQREEVIGWLDRVDADAKQRIPEGPKRDKQCADYPANQSTIDRGISGDFTGMI